MNKDLLAAYGEACVNLEIAQNRHAELKRLIVDEIQKKQEEVKKEKVPTE